MSQISTNNPKIAAISNVVGEMHSDSSFTLDDNPANVLEQPCLLRVLDDGNVKIQHCDDKIEILEGKDFINGLNVIVKKVFAASTTITKPRIRLYY